MAPVSGLTAAESAEILTLQRELAEITKRVTSAAEEKELDRCRTDIWYWFQRYVYTLDETDLISPLKRFPDFAYLRDMARVWEAHPRIRLILYEKSRRMLATLFHCGALVHDAMFGDGRNNFIVSQNEAKAAKQIESRCSIMYDNLPDWMKAAYPGRSIHCLMIFPGQNDAEKFKLQRSTLRKKVTSTIWSVPQRGDQLRGETPSNVLFDEVAAQDQAETNFTGLKPALEAGKAFGPRFVGISTAGTGFWDRLIHDRL